MAAYSPEYIEELRSNFWEAKKWYKDTLESVDYWEAGGYINGDSSLFDYTTTFLTSYIEAVEGPADGSEDLDAIECYYHKKTNQNTKDTSNSTQDCRFKQKDIPNTCISRPNWFHNSNFFNSFNNWSNHRVSSIYRGNNTRNNDNKEDKTNYDAKNNGKSCKSICKRLNRKILFPLEL